MKKIGLISLGCAKNLVDSEIMLATFKKANYQLVTNPKEADLILINTCAFIKEAQQEAIDTILEMARYQKKLVVTGCLVERFQRELKKSCPEINLMVPFSKYANFNSYLSSYLKDKKRYDFNPLNRVISTGANFAYLRIAEGCNNFCSFCAIPFIRGRYKSRPISELVKESKILVNQGIKEIAIIAQDVSNYGIDLKDGSNITKLLKALEMIKGLKHIRLLYLYPSEITDEFINYIKHSKKVYPYFDIPLQHADETILKSMNRKGSHQKSLLVLKKIRKLVPNAIFRTTFIVGYPGETSKAFKKLVNFVKDFKFDHVGVFTYSKEEGTEAGRLSNQINERTKNERKEILMEVQKKISYQNNKKHIGEILEGLYLGIDKDNNAHQFLTKYNAPEGIDGNVFSFNLKKLKVGEYYKLKVKDAFVYDLLVDILE